MAKINEKYHVTKDGVVKKNPKKKNGWVRYSQCGSNTKEPFSAVWVKK